MKQAYIIDGIRTPVGSYQGSLSSVRTDDLAALVIAEIVKRNPQIPKEAYDDVILGCANQAGEDNRNVARMASLLSGLPFTVPGETVNRLCSSGLSAVIHANRAIKSGDGDLFISGGVENMTRGPYVIAKPSKAFGTDAKMYDSSFGWRFVNPKMHEMYGTDGMGMTAENLVEKYNLSREEQDAFAAASQEKASAAIAAGRFVDEITPIQIPQRKGEPLVFDTDEQPRTGSTAEALARLRPAFKKDGTVTAGNASSLNDGAAAVMLMSAEKAKALGLPVLARIVAYANAGVDPSIMGIGPVAATQKCLSKAGWSIADLDLIEANEAFAAQSLSVNQELGWDASKINVNGGAIAIGHPIGASGCRILVSLVHEMIRRDAKKGLATLCIGGGQGVALAIER